MTRETTIAITTAIAGATLAIALSVQAQAPGAPTEDAALLLARLCVSEAGWSCWRSLDGYAIHEVIARTAARHGVSYADAARRRAPRLLGTAPHRSPRLLWCSQLEAHGAEPAAWPAPPHPPWVRYRRRWLAVLERARLVVTFTLDDRDEWSPCDEPPDGWRSPRAALGLPIADCGPTLNTFVQRIQR